MMIDSKFTWQRARRPDQISQRITTILDAAGEIFTELPYEKVTMQHIAERANFTRSNLYRYFQTREEIFLTLYQGDLAVWTDDIQRSFDGSLSLSVVSFVETWTEVLLRQHRLIRLSPLLALSLEKNVSEKLYREFKVNLKGEMRSVLPLLKNALKGYSDKQWADFLLFHGALIAGVWPMSRYSEMQLSVLNDLELAWMRMEFQDFYTRSMIAYLKGTTRT